MKKKKKSTGLHLQASVPETDRKSIRGWFLAWIPVGYMILGVYGWIGTALGIFDPACEREVLDMAVLLLGIWFGILYMQKKRQILFFLITAVAAGMLTWRYSEGIRDGFAGIGAVFLSGFSAQDVGSAAVGSSEVTYAVLVVAFLLYCMFLACFSTEIGKYLVVLILAVPFCMAFVFGQVPDGTSTFCMLFCALGLIVSSAEEHDRQRNGSALILGLLSLVLLLVGFAASEQVLAPLFADREMTRTRIQQTSLIREVQKITEPFQNKKAAIASGGVSDGTINNTEFFLNTGQILFSVSESEQPQGSLYLRVYTGADYTNDQWKAIGDKEADRETFYQRAAASSSAHGYDGPIGISVGFPQGAGDASHAYAPYFSHAQKQDASEKQYLYYPVARLGNLFTETADGLTDDYREYVYKHYLDYPTKGTETMQQFVQEHPGANLEEICNTVRTMLDENAVYNPQVGRFPQEQNFAEYFLFEQKEGYCVHFATAAVLLMRMYGVPARYVTGFAIPSSDFEWQDQAGWTANVVDGRAHAWAEIYVDHYGWIPFETTPSYDSGAELAYGEEDVQPETQEESEMQSDVQETMQDETAGGDKETQAMQKNGDTADGEQETEVFISEEASTVLSIAAVVLAGCVLLLLLFAERSIRLRRRGRQNVKEIFDDLYQVLVFAGMPKELDCMEADFTRKVCEQFLWLNKEELDTVMDIVMRANFSETEPAKEETLQVRGLYRYVCRMAMKGMSRQKKFVFRFIKAYA